MSQQYAGGGRRMGELVRLLAGTDTQALMEANEWTEEQYRAARSQVFARMRMDYLNALYARGLRGDHQKELDIIAAIDAFQDFIHTGRIAE